MEENIHNFQKLTPIDNANIEIYDEALNFAFSNEDIKNIAISGAYSSGKSSILESYKKIHSGHKFLHISLANFEANTSNNSTKNSENILEGKIINQLIHQIDPDNIPQTNFKVKQNESSKRVGLASALFIVFFMLLFQTIYFANWKQYIDSLSLLPLKNLLLWSSDSSYPLFSGGICIVLFGYALYNIILAQKNKRIFRKLSFQGNEIEIFEECKDSYFDKYLNEVLYLFGNADTDVFVFEDMDRYDTIKIFSRLREINTLVNNRHTEKNNPIRFLYLLRDDIFINPKDRTKFFDFILPVVPVMDGSNAYNKFIEYFKQGQIFDLFDPHFLENISLYVDDIRLLKNIFNEFTIYYKRIQSTNLKNDKLLAIVIYKNLFPKDFSELQLGSGFVHTLFDNKSSLIQLEINRINDKINTLNEKIESFQQELLDSIDELDALFLTLNLQVYRVAGKDASTFKSHRDLIKEIKEHPTEVFIIQNNMITNINITNNFNLLEKDSEYMQRKEVIELKSKGNIDQLTKEISQLEKSKLQIQNKRLKDVIPRKNTDSIFKIIYKDETGEENTFNEIKSSPYFPLIKYLIRHGYIDESYPDYMTYFYENSISREDKVFLRSILDQQALEYNFKLNNPELVLSKLKIVDFYNEEILNFDLLNYILQTKETNLNFLVQLIKQIETTRNLKFIVSYLENTKDLPLFIESLNHLWPKFFKNFISEKNYSIEPKKQYAVYTLYYSSENDIRSININNCLTNFISNDSSFLNIERPNVQKLTDGFSLLNVCFELINYDISNKELFDSIYKNHLYKLSFENISLILKVIYGLSPTPDFHQKNFTLILSRPNEPLVEYINLNIDYYIDIILDNCNNCTINDEELAALAIINNPAIQQENKNSYIVYLKTVISELKDINKKDLWKVLLGQRKINYSVNNILIYFFQSGNGLDETLIKFINSGKEHLNFIYEGIKSQFGENAPTEFFNAILICNELSDDRYKNILETLNMYDDSFNSIGISDIKIEILIELDIIYMNENNLVFMRSNYPRPLIKFIIKNISDYVNNVITQTNFVLSEILLVIDQKISDSNKIKLLKLTSEIISIKDKNYSDKVKIQILNNNFNIEDLPYLLRSYSKESKEIKSLTKAIAIKNISVILTGNYKTCFDLLFELLSTSEVTKVDKTNLFLLNLPELSVTECRECLLILKMNDFISLLGGNNPIFPVNQISQDILTIFKSKHWINKFEIDKKKTDHFRAYGRRKID
jgi:hypothetical protein